MVAALAFVIVAAAAAWPVDALKLENIDRGSVRWLPLAPGQVFSITYRHSIYDQPVTEEFVAGESDIRLIAVASESGAVREYFGIDAAGDRHPRDLTMPAIRFRVATGVAQQMQAGATRLSFLDLGASGEAIDVSVAKISSLRYLLAHRHAPH